VTTAENAVTTTPYLVNSQNEIGLS